MNILEFIFSVLCLIASVFVIMGATVTICDVIKVEKENERLRLQLEKARKTIVKGEYKKNKEVK